MITGDFEAAAAAILEAVGGQENVVTAENCITRLRLVLRDKTLVDDAKVRLAGAAGVVRPGGEDVQIIIGLHIQPVADAFRKLCQ